MQIVAYLNYDGKCREAFEFYERVLGGQLVALVPFGDMAAQMQLSEEWKDKLMHARLQVGDALLMASDAPPGRFTPAQGISVSLQLTDPAEAERIFHGLAEGGEVTMPIEPTFWALRFGMVTDRFGIPWMVNCEACPDAGAAG